MVRGEPPVRRRLRILARRAALCATLASAPACDRFAADTPSISSRPEIRLIESESESDAARIEVTGLPRATLSRLRAERLSPDAWSAVFRVAVVEGDNDSASQPDLPPVAGSYRVTETAIVFTPTFGLDPGMRYRATFDSARLPASVVRPSRETLVATFARPKAALAETTIVDHVYPTSDVIPENQLRFYVHFSAPMGFKGGLEYVHLFDSNGRKVIDPFLPLDAEFWNADRTRFTMFVDPGRLKRGVMPNEEMGRSLTAGRQYTLVVDHDWRDTRGVPLKEPFRRSFRVGPPDEFPLDPAAWRLQPPSAGSREPLVVTFPKPLDHGLLSRALGVRTVAGGAVAGEIRIEDNERRWRFTPKVAWAAGNYHLVVLGILEDLAGNRIGRAFEVDRFDRADEHAEPEVINLPFRIGARAVKRPEA